MIWHLACIFLTQSVKSELGTQLGGRTPASQVPDPGLPPSTEESSTKSSESCWGNLTNGERRQSPWKIKSWETRPEMWSGPLSGHGAPPTRENAFLTHGLHQTIRSLWADFINTRRRLIEIHRRWCVFLPQYLLHLGTRKAQSDSNPDFKLNRYVAYVV